MTEKYMDNDLAHETFVFLKKVLSVGDEETTFQPRGPKALNGGRWQYRCEFEGDITSFKGHESISHDNEEIFTHDFFGGLVLTDLPVCEQ